MPGITFAYNENGNAVAADGFVLANNLSGTGAPPAAYLRGGDVACLTQKTTLTANGVSVVRMLIAADKTLHYKEGTPVAGVLGIAEYDCATDGNGIINGNVPGPNIANGAGITYNFPSMAQSTPPDPNSNRSRVQIYLATAGNVFRGALTSAVATHALDGTLGGLDLSTTGGVTTYTISTAPGNGDALIVIANPDESDPLYGSAGGRVFFKFLGSFAQLSTGVPYTSN